MKFISFLAVSLICNLYFSQSTVLYNLHNSALTSNALNKIGVTDLNNNDYIGSPFLNKQFLPSTIAGEKGIHLLRYNIYNDEIIIMQNEEYFKIPKNGLDYFFIDNKYIIRLVNDAYYIQSSNEKDNFVILRKENIKFTPGKIPDNGYGQNVSAKFSSLKPDFFLYNLKEKKLVPFKKEGLKIAFPDKEKEIDRIFKQYKFKSTEDYSEALSVITGG